MTASDQSHYDRVESERRRREAELAALLLLLMGRVRRTAALSIHAGVPPAEAITQALSTTTQPIARAMAQTNADAATRLYDVVKATPKTPPAVDIARYQPAAREYVQTIGKAINEAAQANGTLGQVKSLKAINGSLSDVFDTAGLGPSSTKRISDISTHAVLTADSDGTSEAADEPEAKKKITAFRHITKLDKGTTKICRARHGITLPPDDAYWSRNWPSLHWGCRSVVVPITSEDVKFKSPPDILPPPEPGFGYASSLSGPQAA